MSTEEINSTVKLLSNHMVKVKLEYEGICSLILLSELEQIYELKTQIKLLQKEKNQVAVKEQELYDEIQSLKYQISNLKHESTVKSRIDERNEWKALVDAVNADRTRLQNEVDSLRVEIDKKDKIIARFRANTDPEQRTTQEIEDVTPGVKEDPTQYDNFDKNQLKTEIFTLKEEKKLLRQQLDDFRVQHKQRQQSWDQIEGLKVKLDKELEKKWNYQQKIKYLRNKYGGTIMSLFSSLSPHIILDELDPSVTPYLNNKDDDNFVSL